MKSKREGFKVDHTEGLVTRMFGSKREEVTGG